MTYKFNPFTGKLDTSEGPQGPAGVVSAAGPGSAGTPSISFAADLDTGLYNYTPNGIAVSTGGTGRLFVDASGNVGVGAPGPSDYNNAAESLVILGSSNTGLTIASNSATGASRIYFARGNSSSGSDDRKGQINYLHADDAFTFATAATERLRITSDGKLGLGTSSPTQPLTIASTTAAQIHLHSAAPAIRLSSDTTGGNAANRAFLGLSTAANGFIAGSALNDLCIAGTSGGKVLFGQGNTVAMTIASGGNVGIGTTSPGYKVDIAASSGTNRLRLINSGTAAADQSSLQLNAGASDYVLYAKGNENKCFVFDNNANANRITLDSAGNVGIGTNTPVYPLHIHSASSAGLLNLVSGQSSSIIQFSNSGATDTIQIVARNNDLEFRTDLGSYKWKTNNAASDAMVIDPNGRLGVGTSSPQYALQVYTSAPNTDIAHFGRTGGNLRGLIISTRAAGAVDDAEVIFNAPHPAGSINLSTANLDRLTVTSAGNVGIGTQSPSAILHTSESATGSDAAVIFQNTGNSNAATNVKIKALQSTANSNGGEITFGRENAFNWGVGASCDGYIAFSPVADNVNTERVRITSAGNVGIGTDQPTSILTAGTGSGTNTVEINGKSSSTSVNQLLFSGGGTGNPSAQIEYDGSDKGLAFQVGNLATLSTSEKMRIDTSGRLLVGTNSSSSIASAVLQGNAPFPTGGGLLRLARGSVPGGSDDLGRLAFSEPNHVTAAEIGAFRDGGTWTSGSSQPTKLEFSTTPDGAPSPTPRMTIKNDGNVGIGTTSPAAKLQLSVGNSATTVQADTLAVRGTSGSWAAHIGATSEGGTFIARGNVSTKGQIIFGNTDGSYANYSETARIDSSGRLLVGTPSARSDLSFASVVPSIQLAGGTTSQSSLLLHKFGNDANPCKLILLKNKGSDASSNGGLSVNDPLGIISFEAADGYGGSTLIGAEIGAYAETGHGSANDDAPSRLVFSTTADGASTPTERMRITSGSQVWINTTTGTVDTSNYGTNIGLILNHARNTDGGNAVAQFHGNLGTARVMGNGDLQNTNDVYGAISDIKLKENIVDAESQWDDFKAVRFRKYNFKEETGYETFTQLGVIAQELELVSPGLVTETPDLDEDGNDLGTTTKSVKYSILTKKALVALQEAMERIEQLEAKVAALEAQ